MKINGFTRRARRGAVSAAAAFIILSGGISIAACSKAPDQAEETPSPIEVFDAWAPLASGTETRAVYLQLHNAGDEADHLTGVRSEVASSAGIHQTRSRHGMMGMEAHPEGVMLEPGQRLSFQPGGWHVMLEGVTEELAAGDKFEIVLQFEKAGEQTVKVEVRPIEATF